MLRRNFGRLGQAAVNSNSPGAGECPQHFVDARAGLGRVLNETSRGEPGEERGTRGLTEVPPGQTGDTASPPDTHAQTDAFPSKGSQRAGSQSCASHREGRGLSAQRGVGWRPPGSPGPNHHTSGRPGPPVPALSLSTSKPGAGLTPGSRRGTGLGAQLLPAPSPLFQLATKEPPTPTARRVPVSRVSDWVGGAVEGHLVERLGRRQFLRPGHPVSHSASTTETFCARTWSPSRNGTPTFTEGRRHSHFPVI